MLVVLGEPDTPMGRGGLGVRGMAAEEVHGGMRLLMWCTGSRVPVLDAWVRVVHDATHHHSAERGSAAGGKGKGRYRERPLDQGGARV